MSEGERRSIADRADRADRAGRAGRAGRADRLELAVLVGLVVLAVLPVLAGRYLPFFDYPAHLAVPAALRHRADPSTGVASLWTLDLRLVPNSLHYGVTYLLSFVMPLQLASRLFVAVMCLAALPAAAVMLLRSFGRDWRLAVLVVPVCWNRGLWYGFIGYCAALPLSLLALALLQRDLDRPSLRREVALAGVVAVLALAHFFVMCMTMALAVALVLVHAVATAAPPRRGMMRQLLRCAAPLATGPALMAPWFLSNLRGGPQPAEGAAGHLFAARPQPSDYAALLHHWFIDGYRGRLDDILAVIVLVTLAALIAYVPRRPREVEIPRRTRMAPLILCGVLAAGYVILPFEIRAPFHWWGMNVRLLPLLFIWLLVSVPPGRLDGVGRLALLPVAAATAAFMLYVAADIRLKFNGEWGTAGLDSVLSTLPGGSRVLGIYTDYRQPPHYAHYPFHYASSYAVVRRGGMAAPFVPIPQSWTNPRQVPPYPFAGDAAQFRFATHAPGYSHFLVRTCAGEGCVPDPMRGRVEVVEIAASGRWRLYQCLRERCATP